MTLLPGGGKIRLLNGLGNILIEHYERTESTVSLGRAEKVLSRAVRLTDPGTSGRAPVLDMLGALLYPRHQATGDVTYLEKAEEAYTESVAGSPPGAPARSGRLNNLGAVHWHRYLISGDRRAERDAAEAFRELCGLASRGRSHDPILKQCRVTLPCSGHKPKPSLANPVCGRPCKGSGMPTVREHRCRRYLPVTPATQPFKAATAEPPRSNAR